MKVLITGGTGNLGKLLVETVKAAGHSVRILSRRPHPTSTSTLFEWAQGDLTTGLGVQAACSGVDVIIHSASDPRRVQSVDVQGTKTLVQAAQAGSVRHLVYISIVGIDRIPFSYYQGKLKAEEIIKASGVPYSILRATQFHSLLNFAISFAARVPFVMLLPTDFKFQTIDDLEVANRLTAQVSESPAGMLPDVAGPRVMTVREMVEIWSKARNVRKTLVNLPLPGRVAASFRKGRNTAPDRAVGVITWREWLRQENPPGLR